MQQETSEIMAFKVGRTEGNVIRTLEAFTLLNSTCKYVLMAENQMIPKSNNRKLPRQIDKDTGVFCHDTESCIGLRRVVEHLISEGKLDQYLSTKPTPEQPANRQINMINGGVPIADTNNRSIKK